MTVEVELRGPSSIQLSALASSINAAVSVYSQTTDPYEKEAALRNIELASKQLSQCSVEPRRYLMGFHFQPHQVLCVRLAIEMRIFDKLPTSSPFTVDSLVKSTGTDSEFTGRVIRGLAAVGILEELHEGTFKQTPVSREWANKNMQSYTKHAWDNIFMCMSKYMEFFKERGFVSPSDPMNSPYAFAKGVEDIDFFNILSQDPKSVKVFNEAMTSIKDPLGSMYDFGSLQARDGDVALVDIGGGKGQVSKAYCSPIRNLKESATAYLLKSILHNWPDAECRTILRNLAPAMRGYSSKLLIVELVLSDSNPDTTKVLYDINMLFCAGKERSVKQWHTLLEGTGFRIQRIFGIDNPVRSVMEVLLDE
ncbi:hypothetical protein N7478_011141 [Penicillium angulare]|uniref:uncharacterized protein n=1 Tax=Penicillium angulare TaxID=116970 RepID=UPI002540A448|nr:uncharacterized protein N7478_011141 [Penicillium angulare]KAJ5263536.1 hypothetical protein N7478_011141 [Penicillium angulare]